MRYIYAVTALMTVLAQPASADPANTTFDSLMSTGYDIKAVNFIPIAQATEIFGANAPKTASTTLVTLQKGSSVAVCTFDSGQWAALSNDLNAVQSDCVKR